MADEIDRAQERTEVDTERAIAAARAGAAIIPVGDAGDCDLCGEWCGRLVKGACARCRDKWKLP